MTAGGEAESLPRASVGEYLARQRRIRGITLEELCARTKIPRRNLERLESGALEGQPDGFVRGFVRTVAEALGLDPDEAVMRLMSEPESHDDASEPAASWRRRLRWGLAGVALVLALGGVAAGLHRLTRDPGSAPADQGTGLTYRTDVVRDLAAQARAPAAAAGGGAASLRAAPGAGSRDPDAAPLPASLPPSPAPVGEGP